MKTSKLQKIHRKTLKEKPLKAFRKQKNYVSRLYKKEKKMFFNNFFQIT